MRIHTLKKNWTVWIHSYLPRGSRHLHSCPDIKLLTRGSHVPQRVVWFPVCVWIHNNTTRYSCVTTFILGAVRERGGWNNVAHMIFCDVLIFRLLLDYCVKSEISCAKGLHNRNWTSLKLIVHNVLSTLYITLLSVYCWITALIFWYCDEFERGLNTSQRHENNRNNDRKFTLSKNMKFMLSKQQPFFADSDIICTGVMSSNCQSLTILY